MVVFSSIFRRIHVTLQSNGYYDDDEPMEGWESIPYRTLFDTEDEGEFNKLRTVWKETKKGGFFTVRKEYDKRAGGVGSIKVATFNAFPPEDRVVGRRLEERYDALAQHFLEGNDLEKAPDYSIKAGDQAHTQSTFPRAQTHYQVAAELLEDRGAEGAI